MTFADHNHPYPAGSVAVIFCARRSGKDREGYDRAAQKMEQLAAEQDGYLDMHHARNADGFGITISYWRDEAAAIAWRDHPDHKAIREQGRALWYSGYVLTVSEVTRGYSWP